MLAQSDWPAWIALVFAGGALAWQVLTFFIGRDDRQRKDREVAALRQAQTEALVQIAARHTAPAPEGPSLEEAHAHGAQLSASIVRTGRSRFQLEVTNRGPGGAQLKAAKVIPPAEGSPPRLDTSVLEGGPIDLLPGESARFLLGIYLGTGTPEVALSWIDSRGEQERVQRLTL